MFFFKLVIIGCFCYIIKFILSSIKFTVKFLAITLAYYSIMNKCALTFMLKCLVADEGHFDVKSIFFGGIIP